MGGGECDVTDSPPSGYGGKQHAAGTQQHWLAVVGCEALARATCAIPHKDEQALQLFKECLSQVVRGQLDLGEAQKLYAEKCK